MRKLSAKQKAFCRHYITNGGNATQAAISAGYSKKTAQQTGAENLKKPVIQAKLAEQQVLAQEAFSITVEERLRMLKQVTELGLSVFDHKDTVRPPNLSAVVSAVSEMNKMLGTVSADEEQAKPIQVIFNVRDAVEPQ